MKNPVSKQVVKWIESLGDNPFFASDIFDAVGAETRSQKQNVNKVIERLLSKDALEHAKYKNGDMWRGRYIKTATFTSKKQRGVVNRMVTWIENYGTGPFYLSEICHELNINTRKEQNNASQILRRIAGAEEPLIRKCGTKNGTYQRV